MNNKILLTSIVIIGGFFGGQVIGQFAEKVMYSNSHNASNYEAMKMHKNILYAPPDSFQINFKWSDIDSLSDSVKVQAGYNTNPYYTTTHYVKTTVVSDTITLPAQGISNTGWACVSQHRHGMWGEGSCKAWSYTFPPLFISRIEIKSDTSDVIYGGKVQYCGFLVFNDSTISLTGEQAGIHDCILLYYTYPIGLRATTARKRALADTAKIDWSVTLPPLPPTKPPVVSVNGCPDSLSNALIIRFANATVNGISRDTVTKPVVICGPTLFVYNLMAHPEGGPLVGLTGNFGVLSPPDTSKWVAESIAPLTQGVDVNHWLIPNSSYLASTGLYNLTISAVKNAGIQVDPTQFTNFQIPIIETNDTILDGATPAVTLPVWTVPMTNTGGKIVPNFYYRPARGLRIRTMLTAEGRNVCIPNNVVLYCSPGVTTGMYGSYNADTEWWKGWLSNIIPPTQTSLDVTVIQTSGVGLPMWTLSAP